jgi:dTDP-4-dehydrorhamnose 3,5-epimerase
MKIVASHFGQGGVLVLEPRVHRDARGFFVETFQQRAFEELGVAGPFVQDGHSSSGRGVLRGLHAQLRRPQGKLVRVVEGEIFDVAVDARPGSATFGRWVGVRLSSDNFLQMWIPPGFLHGFCVTGAAAQVVYKCTELYDPSDEIGVLWNDPDLAIGWPIRDPILSDKDRRLGPWRDAVKQFGAPP